MRNTNLIFKLFCAAVLTVSAVTSCYDDATVIPTVKLGSISSEYIVSAVGSTFEIEIYANGPYHIERFDETGDWLYLSEGEIVDEKAIITAEYLDNNRFKRSTQFVLCSDVDSRRDTVTVKQEGSIEAYIEFNDIAVTIPQYAGDTIDSLRTNVLFSEMTIQINYTDEEGWITGMEIINDDSDDGAIRITATENTTLDPRIAVVTLSFTDGWGDVVEVVFNVVQLNVNGEIGNVMSFGDFELNYADMGTVMDYALVEGYIVSNTESHNAGEPDQITVSLADRTVPFMTLYLEAIDGSRGMKLTTATMEDNIFNQFDHVVLLMKGTIPTLKTCGATRLDVDGITKSMIVSKVAGTKDDIPVKDRTITTLTDDDIYTYVRLNDVELPVRKGSLFPVSEASTAGCLTLSDDNMSSARSSCPKYGTLVRGKDGGSLYMWTNDICGYRRDGRRLPQGSGTISGVIVHERYTRYEYANNTDPVEIDIDETLGNVGRYQIRHQSDGDIWDEMNMEFKDGFSELLTEYRYWKYTSNNDCRPSYCKETLTLASDGSNSGSGGFSTYQNGWLTHTCQTSYTGTSSKNQSGTSGTHLYTVRTYDYLGPIGHSAANYFGANWGNKNGCGMVLDPEHDWIPAPTVGSYDRLSFAPDGTVEDCGQYAVAEYVGNSSAGTGWVSNEDCANNPNQINYSSDTDCGKGWSSTSTYLGWGGRIWWDYDIDRFYSFLLMFSTSDVTSTDHLSMQICVGAPNATYAPKYWVAEWAYTDSQDAKDDDQWHTIGEYTVPDYWTTDEATFHSLPAFKPLNFDLPLEILGHKEVYIRLHPTSDLCSDGGDYANAHLSEYGDMTASRHTSGLTYVAIRYNK